MTSSFPPIVIDEAILRPLQDICLGYPEAYATDAFGSPTFKVGDRNFAWLHQWDEGVSAWFKTTPETRQAYLSTEPERYFIPPYRGLKGWIGAWVSPHHDPDWAAIADLVDESYRLIAPKRLSRLLQSEPHCATA